MRNKQLTLQSTTSKLSGQLKALDMEIHRGGSRTSINEAQREIIETIQDINRHNRKRTRII
jgi:hypothetical protein